MSVFEDKDAIREVMAAYCHALDACRFADVASLFADDGIWTTDYGEAKGRGASLAATLPSMRSSDSVLSMPSVTAIRSPWGDIDWE